MRTYRIGMVGTGDIAGIHAEGLAQLGDRARIVAATDVDSVLLDEYGRQWQVGELYPDLPAMLDGTDIDVMHLCTPPAMHHDQARACLAADVDVLCEKPPALSLDELDGLIGAEKNSDAGFATVFQHRFGSAAARLRRLVDDGVLGRPLVAVCNTLWYRPDAYFDVPGRGRWAIEGGGPTLGHGIHQMDLLLSVLGDWTQVQAVAARQVRASDTEDVSCALVTFASDAVATVVNSLVSARETSAIRIDFEYATVELEHLYGYGDDDWRMTAAPRHENAVELAWAGEPRGVPSGHLAQFAAVFDALDGGAPPPVGTAEARRTMELVAAIYASAFEGRTVRVGEIDEDSPFYRRMDGPGAPWA